MTDLLQRSSIQKGIYEHYKGNRYEVIDVAFHSETLDEMVVYKSLYGDYGLWVRPLKMFFETIKISGVQVPRFKLVEEKGV